MSLGVFKTPARPTRNRKRKLSKGERKERYDRIETLTADLSYAIREEMEMRKQSWDVESEKEEEDKWESRKQEVYKGLEDLSDEIQRVVRDRKKEAVLHIWNKEREERRAAQNEEERGPVFIRKDNNGAG